MDQRPGVIVIGPFRSGTSLVCRLLRELGVSFGPAAALVPTDRYNPVGYWERLDVNDANGRLLESAGRTFRAPGDPSTIATDGDLATLDGVDLAWTASAPRWGLKDPRFCGTLSAWTAAGRLDPTMLVAVHVSRDLDAAARSSLRCPWVNHFFDHDPDRVRAGLAEYRGLAERQVAELAAPTADVAYEQLCADPATTIRTLADLIEICDPAAVTRATGLVGRRKAKARLLANRVMGKLSRRAA